VIINTHGLSENEMTNIFEILSKFSIYEEEIVNDKKAATYALPNQEKNKSTNYTLSSSFTKTKIYKHITIWFLVHQEENLEKYQNYFDETGSPNNYQLLKQISEKTGMQIFIKFLYDKFKGVVNSDNFYGDLKNYNSKSTFEELNDEEYLNILIMDEKNSESSVKIYFNKDIDSDIFLFNVENFFSNEFEKILLTKMLPQEIKDLIKYENILNEIIKINQCNSVKFSRLMAESLDNLEKINKIFNLYETIRTIDHVKEKVMKNILKYFYILV
jgi:hypothetical protein